MISKGIFIGKVVFVEPRQVGEQETLQVTLNVPTGEKKKEGEQYPPSNMVQFTLWGSYAAAMQQHISKGIRVYVEGKVAIPYAYEKEGEMKVILKLHKVDEVKVLESTGEGEPSTSKSTKATTAATKTKKAPVPVDEFEDLDDINFDD